MKNSNLHIVVRSAATLACFALVGAVLTGCGEDPILIAELIGAGQQPSSDPTAPPALPESGPPSPAAPPEEPDPNTPAPTTEELVPPANALEAPAFDILIRYCGLCHDTAPEEGFADFNYLSDLDLLLANGQIVAGSKEESRIYVRMLAGTMPPGDIVGRPTLREIELVGAFIDSLPYGDSASD